MAIITIVHKIGGTATDADSTPVLSSEDASYGVKRSDTDAVVVADGTAMTKTDTGTYTYSVTEPATGLTYLYSIELTYNGVTTYITGSVAGAATATSSLTGLGCDFTSLRREVGRHLGFDETVSNWSSGEVQIVNDCITEGLRLFYHPQPINGLAHEWSFLKPAAILETTAPYTTGTVTVSSGVVTLDSGTFPSWAANGIIEIASNGTYYVDTRDGDTQITLEDTSVTEATSRTFSLYRYSYDLESDFGALCSKITLRSSAYTANGYIESRGEHQIRNWLSGTIESGKPRYYALRPASFNVNVGTRWEMLFYPMPDAAYKLAYVYKIDPGQLSESAPYPAGGAVHASTIRAACLAAADLKENQYKGELWQTFMERLQSSIALDGEATSPDTLGCMEDTTPTIVYGNHDYRRVIRDGSSSIEYGS
ncbi:hypothetical protein [Bremerella sp. P1]|uniref:hypothetical protein n=1 Tax=Bremerella sp. P1 TaxID=3026424 RepID=UPI002367B098|nr:hypothetical protein [Bremerella sp. P1]WDI44774.1 hypothetical protein PSR63_12590 [Bremerella sp. P1]